MSNTADKPVPKPSAPNVLETLFPVPCTPASTQLPPRWPGITHESTATLQKVMKDNHDRWHVFFNDRGFHNHMAHHILAIWAMGAPGPVIEAAYETHCAYLLPAFSSPEAITEENFYEHLGNEKFYNAYILFFTKVVLEKGASRTLEEYIFSDEANFAGKGGKQPQMLARFLAGLLHPLIHVGYGAEFGLPGVFIQGLAQTAVHPVESGVLLPSSFFSAKGNGITSPSGLTSMMSALVLDTLGPLNTTASNTVTNHGPHALTIVARMLNDPELKWVGKRGDEATQFAKLLESKGSLIRSYADMWIVELNSPSALEARIEELIWMNTILFGVGGWKEGKEFNADFLLMHLVTSATFLPSLTAYLTPTSQSLLLRAYFTICLGVWVLRGRPSLDFRSFFSPSGPTANPATPGPLPSPSEHALPSPTSPLALTANSWLPIVQTTLIHPNEHLCKLQRALVYYSVRFGGRAAGHADFAGTELSGAELIDGTLFIRIAGWLQGSLDGCVRGKRRMNGTLRVFLITEERGFLMSSKKKR